MKCTFPILRQILRNKTLALHYPFNTFFTYYTLYANNYNNIYDHAYLIMQNI